MSLAIKSSAFLRVFTMGSWIHDGLAVNICRHHFLGSRCVSHKKSRLFETLRESSQAAQCAFNFGQGISSGTVSVKSSVSLSGKLYGRARGELHEHWDVEHFRKEISDFEPTGFEHQQASPDAVPFHVGKGDKQEVEVLSPEEVEVSVLSPVEKCLSPSVLSKLSPK